MAFSGLIEFQSRHGNPYDKAVMESFFKYFKREVLHQHHFKTKAEATSETVDYLENHYNNDRIHSALGYLTSTEFKKMHF